MNSQSRHHGSIAPFPASQRGFSFRQMVLSAAVVGAVAVAGVGGYVYYRNNSTSQLAQRAQIALEQHDAPRAIDFVKRALDKNPTGATAVGLRDLMAQALIDAGREGDARAYIEQALAQDPGHVATLDLLARSHVNPAFRRLREAFKPISTGAAADLYKTIEENLGALEKLPQSARNMVAEAELHRLYYLILSDQYRQATAELDAAHIADDTAAASKAEKNANAIKAPEAQHRDIAVKKLQEALKTEPKHERAAALLADYQYQDHEYADALALYERMKAAGAVSDELALTAARTMIADAQRQANREQRLKDAQQVLEGYLKDHADNERLMVALGDVVLDQGDVAGASKLAEKAAALAPHDMYAQILLVNCRLHDRKSDEALRLITPMTTAFPNKPEVWYLLGQAQAQAGDMPAAGNAFRKALAVNPSFSQAREELLAHERQAGNEQSASLIAAQVLKDDRYNMFAWDVTIEGLKKTGQVDRARTLLVTLANDPDLPMESRPELIQLLAAYGAPRDAQRLLSTLPPEDHSTLSLRALVAAASGNSPEARELMGKALAANPADVDLRLRYIDLLGNAGLTPDVRAQLDELTAGKTPLTVEQSLRAARGYLSVRLPAKAAAVVQPILDKNPKQAEAAEIAQAARQLAASGGQGSVPASAPASIDMQNAALPELVRFAQAALQRKDYQGALGTARGGLAREKNNRSLHEIAARALAGLGKPDQAVEEVVQAAQAAPDEVEAYWTFVQLFPTADAAIRGIGFGSRLEAVNPALGAWAMGRLAETSGQLELAVQYYMTGIGATSKLIDPRPARDQLYQSLLAAQAARKDIAALKKTADDLANGDASFASGIRLLASDQLLAMGDRQGAAQQLEAIKLAKSPPPPQRLVLAVANRWLALGQGDRARSLMETQVAAEPNAPELLDGYATLLSQAGDVDKAVEVRTKLASLDQSNPRYRVALAEAQANAGDVPAALRTLDDAGRLGATGAELAGAVRVRMLITMGLLDEATRELQSRSSGNSNDYASLLAVAQAWVQLNKPEDARKLASQVPVYAAQHPGAQLLIASLDLEAGGAGVDKAIGNLEGLLKRGQEDGAAASEIGMQLFRAYVRKGEAPKALQLATAQRALYARNMPSWRTWTTYAAAAAREGKQYSQAIDLLNEMDADARRPGGGAALDIALMEVLQHMPVDAAGLAEAGPAYNRYTLQALAGKAPAAEAGVLKDGLPSAVIAALAAMPAQERAAAAGRLAENPNLIGGDMEALVREAGSGEDSGTILRQVALAQRLNEAGWTTTALDVLAPLEKRGIAYVAVQRHQALTDLHRFAEADAVRDAVAKQAAEKPQEVSPSVRILLAASLAKQEKYPEALQMLQPLAALNRPEVLTTLATMHEKMGELNEAIALHRQVLKIDPNNLAAANNLAYTLAAAHPTDKAVLGQAREAIESAISKAPQITAFQDTKGWIQILSGQAAEGTRRIARVLPSLRLDPAVHYHLGVGYARIGQNDLARMHLQNVAHLAHEHQHVPELPLASEALRAMASTQ
jgi:tetratricopeptide (TPR) repeat protein